MFQGKAQPSSSTLGSTDTATLNAVAEHKGLQSHQCLWSVLLLTTSGSANNAVKTFEGKRPEDGAGHGQLVAWKALTEKYNGHTNEARRACHEKVVNTKMEPGQDPDDLFLVLDECRDLLEMGQTVHDERYVNIIHQALPLEYQRVRTASYERRDHGLNGIRHMVHTTYADNRSRSVSAKPIAGLGIAEQVVGHTSSDVQCN